MSHSDSPTEKERENLATLLGEYGTRLADTPLGSAMSRVTDAVAAYCVSDESSPEASLMADSATKLCGVVLDLLLELGVTETE